MAATVTFLALAFRYLVREGYASSGKALLVVALAAVNGRTVILATSMYSEMIYAALSVGGLWLAERYLKERLTWAAALGLGLAVGLAFLTRTSGIALLMAVAACCLLRGEFRKVSV